MAVGAFDIKDKDKITDDIDELAFSSGEMDDMFDADSLLSLLDEVTSQENNLKKAVEGNKSKATEKIAQGTVKKDSDGKWMNKVLSDLSTKEDAKEDKQVVFDINDYPREIYSEAQLSEIRKGIANRVDIRIYSDVKYTGRQMREIRYGLERNLDVSHYANVLFRERQMRQIRLGLQQGLDVSSYARLLFSATDMREKRRALFAKEKLNDIENLSYDYDDRATGIHIYVEPGLMEAGIVIKNKLPEPFTRGDLKKLMDAYDLTYGFAAEELPDNLANLPLNVKIPVLHGKKPVRGADGYYKNNFEMKEHKPVVNEDGSVDFYAPVEYKKVKRGDVVAEYVPADKGTSGKTVTGIVLDGMQGKDAEPLDSMDLIQSRDKLKYLSKKDGFLSIKDGKISIMDYLMFPKDVGLADGAINFDGGIQINGNVLEGAKITSSGDIFIRGYVSSANIVAKGNIIINGGVNAEEDCSIIAGGDITSAFFENAKIECDGNIEVGYILNSEVISKGRIRTKGRKSLICGGSVIAQNGIDTGTIGSKNKAKTYVEVGLLEDDTDEYYALFREKQKQEEQEEKTHLVMDTIIQKLGALKGRQDPNYIKLQVVLSQIKAKKDEIEKGLAEISRARAKRSEIGIDVARDLFENVTVSVNGNKLVIREDQKHCKVRSNGRAIEIN